MAMNLLAASAAAFIMLTPAVHAQTVAPTLAAPPISQPPAAQPEEVEPQMSIQVFKGPQKKRVKPPAFPESERARGRDGWVNVNFMIDPQGKPYEITVTDSTGNETFEKEAVKAAAKFEFEPATLAGVPVDAGYNMKMTFLLTGDAGANPAFVKARKQFQRAMKSEDRTQADAALARMKVQNLYEDAYFSLAQYEYARRWGTQSQQLHAIRHAIAEEHSASYLPKEAFVACLQVLLDLQIKHNDFAGALHTWGKLQELADPATMARWEKVIGQINALRNGAQPYSVAGDFGDSSSWGLQLFRNKFQVAVASGHVAEIKLRCEKAYVFFKYEADVQYTVSNKAGACNMELVGDPGTRFSLIQL